MMAQSGLFGGFEVAAKPLKKKRSAKSIIAGECCKACYMAQEEVCKCRCGGKFHGAGNPGWNRNQKRLGDEKDDYDIIEGLRKARAVVGETEQ